MRAGRRYYSRDSSITRENLGLKYSGLGDDLSPIPMFGNLRLFSWATEKPKGGAISKKSESASNSSGKKKKKDPRRQNGWFLDRNWDRSEGERLLKAKKYVQAERHLARAVTEAAAKRQSAAKRIHLALLLAEAQRRQFGNDLEDSNLGKLADAEQTVQSASRIAQEGKERGLFLQCLDALADVFALQGRFDAVEATMLEAIKLESSARTDKLSSARRVVRLGVARHRLGRAKEAIPVLENAVALHEKAFGKEHMETASQLAELGGALRADGRHEEAQNILRRALAMFKAQRKLDSPPAIQALHHLAGSLEETGDLEAAAEQYETALTYKQRTIGSNLDDLAELQYGLANLHISWKNYGRARELLHEAVGNFRRTGGLRLAVTHETLAYVDECSGRYDDAVQELAAAGRVWDLMRPERTQELIHNMERRVELLEQLRRKGEAAHLLDKVVILNHQLEDELSQGLVSLDQELRLSYAGPEDPSAMAPVAREGTEEQLNAPDGAEYQDWDQNEASAQEEFAVGAPLLDSGFGALGYGQRGLAAQDFGARDFAEQDFGKRDLARRAFALEEESVPAGDEHDEFDDHRVRGPNEPLEAGHTNS
jgi:Tetratricopeptide repeat